MIRSRTKGVACALLIVSITVGVGMPAITGQTAERTTVKIGTEALVELPQAALWSGVVNFRPGDGEVVKLNPPRFSWSYTPDPANADADIEAKQFVFQIAYEPGFTNPVVNLQTVSNMYNLLAPLTQKTVYWRVGYIHDGATTPYAWSAVRSFTVADDAVPWDRSMLADKNYLASKGQHPHILFNASNRQALYQWLQARGDKAWTQARQQADDTIAQTWWPATKPSTLWEGAWANNIANVIFVWQLTQDPKYLNAAPQQALLTLARYYVDNNGPITDSITQQQFTPVIRALAVGYDWLYGVMSPVERQEVLHALELRCAYINKSMGWWWHSKNPSFDWGKGDPTGEYPGGSYTRRFSHAKKGDSHTVDNFHWTMLATLAAYPESQEARTLFNLGVNYIIGFTYPYGSEGSPNQGRAYSMQGLFETKALMTHIFYQITFPEVQLNKNPFWHETADWWDHSTPVGFVEGHEPWGDAFLGPYIVWGHIDFGRNLAYFTGSRKAMKHWKGQVALNGTPPPVIFDQLLIPFYFSAPAEADNTILGRMFPYDGWAMGCSSPSNTKACFQDGVGFVFQARPRGSEAGHSHFSDLSYQLWAYGSTITDAGALMTSYAKIPMSHYSILVDGLGTVQPQLGPNVPYYSRIFAFKETPDYTYVAADGTNAYPRKNFQVGGWLLPATFSTLHSGGPLSYLQKVHRHILFVRKKYFVIFDALESEKPAKFTWLYHLLEDTLQLDAANASFSYTSNTVKYTSKTPGSVPNPDVPVYVAHISQPGALEVLDLTGNKVRSNPLTGEDYYSQGDSYIRAHALWFTNKVPQNTFRFMTVIYPAKPGTTAPQIKRLDDFTVEVTHGAEHDVISFDSQTKQPATLVVDSAALGSLPNSAPDAPKNRRVVPQ